MRASRFGTTDPLPWPRLDPLPPGWLDDTPVEAVARWKAQTAAQRWRRLVSVWVTGRAWPAASERMRYPHVDDVELLDRLGARRQWNAVIGPAR